MHETLYELIELWHAARTAGATTRYERLKLVAIWYHERHPAVSRTRAYLMAEEAISHTLL